MALAYENQHMETIANALSIVFAIGGLIFNLLMKAFDWLWSLNTPLVLTLFGFWLVYKLVMTKIGYLDDGATQAIKSLDAAINLVNTHFGKAVGDLKTEIVTLYDRVKELAVRDEERSKALETLNTEIVSRIAAPQEDQIAAPQTAGESL